MDKLKIEEFIIHAKGVAKESALLIAYTEEQKIKFTDTLIEKGFQQISNISELCKRIERPHLIFIDLDKFFTKPLYDFICQYPTGQINWTDLNYNQCVINPEYSNSLICYIVTKNKLFEDLEKTKGYLIREKIGMTYQE